MTRRVIFLIITLVSVIGVQAESIHSKIAKAQRALPLRQELFTLDQVNYNFDEDAVEASFTYRGALFNTDVQAQVQMIATVLGLFMTSDPNMKPFNLILSVTSPSSSTPQNISYSKSTVRIYMDEVRKIFNNDASLLEILTNELDNIPMQCDAQNNFCYTMSYNKQRKEIQLDYQLLSDEYIQLYENSENVFTGSLVKLMGESLKAYKNVIKNENITLKISVFKKTNDTPFQIYRLSAEELFGD